MKKISLFLGALLLLSSASFAQLRVTEAMSSGGTADWIEITNLGSTAVDLTGYKIDDSSFAYGNSVALNGISSISSGESVIFGESGSATFAADFRTFWGLAQTVQVGNYSGSGIGLSSNGDGVIIFDATGAEVTRVSFGAATANYSFFWGYTADGSFDTNNVGTNNAGLLSSLGNNAGQLTFTSANVAANVGSPGDAILAGFPVTGCLDALACNYDANATVSSNACTYAVTYYLDADGDGYGVAGTTTSACSLPVGYALLSADCNDAASTVNPGVSEQCYNDVDENCDGSTTLNCALGAVSIASASNFTFVNENAGTVTIPVTMASATTMSTTVQFSLSVYSDATEGSDYTWTNSFVIPANSNGVFNNTITITDDNLAEKAERIVVKIASADYANVDATNNYRIIFIKDNDYLAPVASNQLNMNLLSSFSNGAAGTNSAEIVSHDASTQRLYIANSIAGKLDIVNFSNPSAPTLISSISMAPYGNINSVVAHNGIVACAIENVNPQSNGFIVFFDSNGTYVNQVPAGAMPDMICFSKDYTKVLTANEGEPNSSYSSDPEGSVTIVDITGGVANLTEANATQISLTAYNGQEATLRAAGIRIFSTSASVAQDLEPEYIAVSDDNTRAYVDLQENNAMLVINLTTNTIEDLRPLGYISYADGSGNGMDASDQSGSVLITGNLPIKGVYMPDAISYATVGGTGLIFTANEGDSREFGSVVDANRISSSTFNNLDATAFPDANILRNNKFLGRLSGLKYSGDTDGDGDYDEIHVMGGRSFSIFNAATGSLVFDSKDLIEQITSNSSLTSAFFNASNTTGSASLKNRSDDKGPEPEGVTTAVIAGRPYAFVSLERVGGVMIFNIENPSAPIFVGYANNRTLNGSGPDLGAEGIIFIKAADSPTGQDIVILANEVSSTLSVFSVSPCTAPGTTQTEVACGSFEWNGQTYTSTGTYTHESTNNDGCIVTDVLNLTIQTTIAAIPTIVTGEVYACAFLAGGTTTYSTPAVAGTTYEWVAPAGMTIVSGQGTNTITVSFSNTFVTSNLKVRATNDCGTSAYKFFQVKRLAPATPATLTSATGKACPGDAIVFTAATMPGATSYNWTAPAGATVTAGQGTNIATITFNSGFTAAGVVAVTASNGCGVSVAKTKTIGLNMPLTPSVITGTRTVSQNQTAVPYSVVNVAGMTYNWTVAANFGSIATGQGNNAITVNATNIIGTGYTMSVTATNACGTSPVRAIANLKIVAGVSALELAETPASELEKTDLVSIANVSIFPNPASDFVTLQLENIEEGTVAQITIFDLTGKQVFNMQSTSNLQTIDVSQFAKGMYVIHVNTATENFVQKLQVK